MFEPYDIIEKCAVCDETSCYVQQVAESIKVKMCFNCGFSTNSIQTTDSEFLKEQLDVLPFLYKQLAGEAKDGLVWIPTFIDTDNGNIFAHGNGDDWKWCAFKKMDISPDEKYKFTIPGKPNEFYTRKVDHTTESYFEQDCFLEALAYIGELHNVIKAD